MNTPNSCGKLTNVWVIQDPTKKNAYFTILDPWNRGFYNTSDPKCFKTKSEAQKFMEQNSLNGALKTGFMLDNGFHEGVFDF